MENQIGSGTVRGLLEFLDQLVAKGRTTSGGVIQLKSAVKQVLVAVDGKEKWLDTDVRSINISDYMDRFSNLTKSKGYSIDSIKTYRARLQKAITWYGSFLVEPGWAPPKATARSTGANNSEPLKKNLKDDHIGLEQVRTEETTLVSETSPGKGQANLITHSFPLRVGIVVNLYLPIDLSFTEAKRLGRFLESLSVDNPIDEPS